LFSMPERNIRRQFKQKKVPHTQGNFTRGKQQKKIAILLRTFIVT